MAKGRTASVRRRATYGVIYLGTVALAAGLLLLQSQGAFRDTVEVSTKLDSVGDGLPVGADVKMRGAIIGRVSGVDATLDHMVVRLQLDPKYASAVPASVQSRILPTNAFGAPYVDLRVTGTETPTIARGAEIPQDLSKGTVQMQTVFQKVYDVLVAVEPAKLNVTLNAIADALSGNGERLGRIIERADSYLSSLNANADVFAADLTELATTLEGVQRAAPDLLEAADNVSATARLVVDTRNDMRAFFQAGTRTSSQLAGFLSRTTPPITRGLDAGSRLAVVLAPLAPDIDESLVTLGQLSGRLTTAVPGHKGARIAATVTSVMWPQYTSADCPHYPGLAGPNCGAADPQQATPLTSYGGTVGSVGSPEEKRALGKVLGNLQPSPQPPLPVNEIPELLLGPVLRGIAGILQ